MQLDSVSGTDPEALQIQLLGRFRVAVGARAIAETAWRLRKVRSLIKLLALAPTHRLQREQVMDILWPDLEPEAAANSLHQTLHVARRILDPSGAQHTPYLQLQDEILSLCPTAPLWIDVEAFEAAAARAHRTQHPADYQAAIALYTGELLPEDRYADWVSARREALAQEYLTLLLNLARLAEAGTDYALGIASLQQLLASDPTHEVAHRGLMRLYALTGQRQLALRQYQLLQETLQREFETDPDPYSQRLYQDILAGRFPPTTPLPVSQPTAVVAPPAGVARPNNLPVPLTSFIGRERDLAEVQRLLSTTRLLTLAGPGGCGKTRLALELAAQILPAYTDGVWLIGLAPLYDPALIPAAVAAGLGVREEPGGRPLMETLASYLQPRHMLLVLDNCEHLVAGCAELVEALLRVCPALRIVATSREALHVAGELIWLIPSLALPDLHQLPPLAEVSRYGAVRLFVERAAALLPTFTLTEHNAPAIAQVCCRLDGMPLALELAAARVPVLAVEQILERLDDRFRLLTSGSRTAVTRQQTLQATLDWSYDLLTEPERVLFRRLAVFAGSFNLAAAEAICAGDGIAECDVLDLLTQLVGKSLVVRARDRGGTARYRLLETIRQYGWALLTASTEAPAIQQRYATFFVELAEEAEPKLTSAERGVWLERLDVEQDNLRAALTWGLYAADDEEIGLRLAGRLAGALSWFWLFRERVSEARDWLGRALARRGTVGRSVAWAQALSGAGRLAWVEGDTAIAHDYLEQSVALWRDLGDQRGLAYTLTYLGVMEFLQGDYAPARACLSESVAAFRQVEDRWGLALALFYLGDAVVQNDLSAARLIYEESLAIYQELGDRLTASAPLLSLGRVALYEGDYTAARVLVEESLAIRRAAGSKYFLAIALTSLAEVAWYQGEYAQAKGHCVESLALHREIVYRPGIAWALHILARLAQAQGDDVSAVAHFKESLALERDIGGKRGIARCLAGLGGVARLQGQWERAARLAGAAVTLQEAIGVPMEPAEQRASTEDVAAVQAMLGEEVFSAAWRAGRALPLDQAIAEALSA